MEENEVTNKKIYGLNIAALVLGIVAIALWCFWCVSIPCAILALIFGIIGMKKQGKAMAIAGIITGAISLAIWIFIFFCAFMFGFINAIDSAYDTTPSSYSYFYDDFDF